MQRGKTPEINQVQWTDALHHGSDLGESWRTAHFSSGNITNSRDQPVETGFVDMWGDTEIPLQLKF